MRHNIATSFRGFIVSSKGNRKDLFPILNVERENALGTRSMI